MKLIVQPDDGIAPIVTGIKQAKRTVDVLIFRLDRLEIATALEQAVARGVHVRALTAHQNRGGTKSLRKLEMHLLEGGVTVSRTADDLVRYHGKMMIIDGRLLHVYGYNFTSLDIEKSRSFGVITKNPKLVAEAMKLFEADFERQPYMPGNDRFIVSPENARERLSAFLKGARKQLLIYDPKVSDDAMVKVIRDRMEAGVDVRVIGKVDSKSGIRSEKYSGKRLHIRAIIRDGSRAFLGSQSLRRLELEKRREVGVIITDERVILGMRKVFEDDWAQTDSGKKDAKKADKAEKKDEKALAVAP
ncbi:MAG TPA: phospholipase D-like domain-containing protein [Vicinamibacterales bacterium]|jgi:phosphatidylserine/phosphatidylglycerophosphate/cardiolipin synthase-like enzyme